MTLEEYRSGIRNGFLLLLHNQAIASVVLPGSMAALIEETTEFLEQLRKIASSENT